MSQIDEHLNLALMAIENDDIQNASLHLRAILSIDINHAVANAVLGELALNNKQYETAIDLFETALKSIDGNTLLLNNLGLALHRSGQVEKSRNIYESALERDEGNANLYCNFANLLAECGDIHDALVFYNRALDLNPQLPQIWYNVGNCFNALAQTEKAKLAYTRCLSLERDYVNAHVAIADVHLSQNNLPAAFVHYQSALKTNKTDERAHLGLATLHLEKGELKQASFAFANHGAASLDNGNLNAAFESLNKALELDASLQPAHANMACALMKSNEWKKALIHADIALRLAPSDSKAMHNYALALLGNERHYDALVHIRRAIAQSPTVLDYQSTHAKALMMVDREQSMSIYRHILEIDENHVTSHRNLGFLELQRGEWRPAYHHLSKAYLQLPKSAALCDDMAMACHGLNSMEEAMSYHEMALRIEPENSTFLTHMGLTVAKLGHHLAALHINKKAIRLNEDFAIAYNNMGNAYRDLNQIDEALKSYKRAIGIQPGLWEAHINYGNLLKEIGVFTEAAHAYKMAIHYNPNAMRAYRQLSIVEPPIMDDPIIAQWEKSYHHFDGPNAEKSHMAFALAAVYHKSGEVDKAIHYYASGNALHRSSIEYDEKDAIKHFEDVILGFNQTFLNKSRVGSDSIKPIFIVGLPRSGTTLVEQILSTHSGVDAAGEQPWISEIGNGLFHVASNKAAFPLNCLDIPDEYWLPLAQLYLTHLSHYKAERVTDKMPINAKYIGLIHHMFPNATIVHVQRDLMETGFSIFQHHFSGNQPFAYSLDEIGNYICAHQKLMHHWHNALPGRIYEMSYETLVENPEAVIRDLLTHCRLEWEPSCLDFHKNTRRVKTASLMQVRRPIFRSGLKKSRQYEAYLGPLFETLGSGF